MTVRTLLAACVAVPGLLGLASAQQPPPQPAAPPAAAPADDAYVPYAVHDIEQVLGSRPGADGKIQHYVDIQLVKSIYDDLARHAQNYPVDLRSDAERERARNDAGGLSVIMESVTVAPDAPTELLLLAARVHALAHNLDVPQAAGRATASFERILAREPDNAEANFHFGAFLAASDQRPKDAAACLEKAARAGIDAAWFSLGMLQLTQGDQEHALQSLETYTARMPSDTRTRKMVEGLRSGKLKFKPR